MEELFVNVVEALALSLISLMLFGTVMFAIMFALMYLRK